MRRLIAGFSKGTGIASPALILVWFVLGAGLTWFHLHLSGAGVALASGTVTTVNSDPQFGTHISLDSSTLDFFFDSTDYPRLPDVRVGDHVDILTQAEPQGWAVAAQSSRGLWIDTIYGDEVAPFSPHTWFLHEILSWAALAVGIAAALL
ncbi:MAG TPA: hypothetical protein VHM88_20200, partial [Candidatus Acidoferrales bacterium]|nr:hypothetical protein [Candidatus Acidoferrales bacterium]